MNKITERRKEKRLHYHWPVWFAEDFDEELSQGQMADICSGGAAFTCRADNNCPYSGQQLTTRFSIPNFAEDGSFEMANYTRSGTIRRVDEVNNRIRRVAIEFAEPLDFKPAEQAHKRQISTFAIA